MVFRSAMAEVQKAVARNESVENVPADEVHQAIPAVGEQDREHLHDRTPRTRAPAAPDDTERVYFSDLLAIPAGDAACPCCGKAPWWDHAGRRTCGVCHPNPRRAREALKTKPTTMEAAPHVA